MLKGLWNFNKSISEHMKLKKRLKNKRQKNIQPDYLLICVRISKLWQTCKPKINWEIATVKLKGTGEKTDWIWLYWVSRALYRTRRSDNCSKELENVYLAKLKETVELDNLWLPSGTCDYYQQRSENVKWLIRWKVYEYPIYSWIHVHVYIYK